MRGSFLWEEEIELDPLYLSGQVRFRQETKTGLLPLVADTGHVVNSYWDPEYRVLVSQPSP